jgi:glycogen debranching enzyme
MVLRDSYQQVINNTRLFILCSLVLTACTTPQTEELDYPLVERMSAMETLQGNANYLHSKQMTPGNHAYCVGFQDGTFPDIGWHIKGEMGGLWAHPIKLLDGFSAAMIHIGDTVYLDSATSYSTTALGSIFTYNIQGKTITRTQFIPDPAKGMVVEYDMSEFPKAQLLFYPRADLRPTWLGERTNMIDSTDIIAAENNQWTATDAKNGWQVRISASSKGAITPTHLTSSPSKTHQLYIAGGLSEEEATKELTAVQSWSDMWYSKEQKHFELSGNSSFFCEGEEQLETVFRWLKHNAIWLEMDADTLGYGFAAGIEDYPWFFGCDSEFSILGLNAVGRYDLSKSMLRLLAKASERTNGTGQIIHEMSTNGAVFNPGNLNETPQFVTACYDTYRWSGDKVFFDEMYPQMIQSMKWLQDQDADGNGIPDGYGMMEIHGMNGEMIDVAAYTVQAWGALYESALLQDDDKVAAWAGRSAAELSAYINENYWVKDAGAYADVRGSKAQVLELIDGAIERAEGLNKPWAVEELETTKKAAAASVGVMNPYSVHHNWIVNTPMEVGFAPEEYALKALDKAAQYTNPFGMFVTGIDRDESAGTDTDGFAKRKKTFTYVGAVMTLPTGVAAVAENNYGRPDKALDYLHRMSRSWGYAHPGSMYEVSPDFGMMCQAWNIYSFGYPIVRQFFGIYPMAEKKIVEIDPHFPTSWTRPQLKRVVIGEGEDITELDISFVKGENGNKNQLHILQTANKPWSIMTPVQDHARIYVDDALIQGEDLLDGMKKITGHSILIEW